MKLKITYTLPMTVVCFCAPPCYAAEVDVADIEEIIVTATPMNRAADDLTQSAMVLSADELLLKAAGSIGETLANELGVSSTYFGPVAGRPVIRGQEGPRISVLQSGISTLDVSDLSPDHAVTVEPLFADRVEIIRGAGTLLYGSSAAGGVVNVVDNRIPDVLSDTSLRGAAELRADTAADERAALLRVDGSLESLAWHVDGVTRESGNVEIAEFATKDSALRPAEELEGILSNSAGESDSFAAGVSYIRPSGMVGFSYSELSNQYGLPGPELEEEGDDAEIAILEGPIIKMEQSRLDLKAKYDFKSVVESVRFKLSHNDYTHVEVEPSGEIGTEFLNDAWEARTEVLHVSFAGWQGATGVQIGSRDFAAIGEEAFIPKTETQTAGVFFLQERQYANTRVELAARFERKKHDPESVLGDYSELATSIAAGIVWEFAGDYDLSANISRTERHPDAAELYSDGAHLATGLYEIGLLVAAASPISMEVARNVDLAVHHHHAGIAWELSVFYNDIDNFIYRDGGDLTMDGLPVAPYVQDDATFYGYEAELLLEPEFSGVPDWSFRLFTDYVRANTDQGDLPRIQPRRWGVSTQYTRALWSAGVGIIYHDKQDEISSFRTAAFTALDANFVYSSDRNAEWQWEIFVKGSNLLDEDARRSTSFRAAYVPLPGRSLHAGLRLRFN